MSAVSQVGREISLRQMSQCRRCFGNDNGRAALIDMVPKSVSIHSTEGCVVRCQSEVGKQDLHRPGCSGIKRVIRPLILNVGNTFKVLALVPSWCAGACSLLSQMPGCDCCRCQAPRRFEMFGGWSVEAEASSRRKRGRL